MTDDELRSLTPVGSAWASRHLLGRGTRSYVVRHGYYHHGVLRVVLKRHDPVYGQYWTAAAAWLIENWERVDV